MYTTYTKISNWAIRLDETWLTHAIQIRFCLADIVHRKCIGMWICYVCTFYFKENTFTNKRRVINWYETQFERVFL